MSLWTLDPDTHDRVRINGQFQRVTGAEETIQLAKVRALILRTEVFLNTAAGADYFNVIFAKGTPENLIAQELVDVIGSTPGLTQVRLELTFDPDRVQDGSNVPQFDVAFTGIYDAPDQRSRREIQGSFRIPGALGEIAT